MHLGILLGSSWRFLTPFRLVGFSIWPQRPNNATSIRRSVCSLHLVIFSIWSRRLNKPPQSNNLFARCVQSSLALDQGGHGDEACKRRLMQGPRPICSCKLTAQNVECKTCNLSVHSASSRQMFGRNSAIAKLKEGTHTLPTNCSGAIKGKTMSPVRRRSHEGATEMHITRS